MTQTNCRNAAFRTQEYIYLFIYLFKHVIYFQIIYLRSHQQPISRHGDSSPFTAAERNKMHRKRKMQTNRQLMGRIQAGNFSAPFLHDPHKHVRCILYDEICTPEVPGAVFSDIWYLALPTNFQKDNKCCVIFCSTLMFQDCFFLQINNFIKIKNKYNNYTE